ncbi:roadblock/LC7 domain-containing protein [Dactylosporangium sucinum]|uniref:Dynein regulation protein LC7 n=1 Tax=Dactylosporangium sucinum TaxID=1424081 RepID=A0A917TTJ0_9ACTN|nr:roadblock/LC7 domain-containing protein [Dactylosporangium sucinum]GGM36772.1 dynein regulation protein LC7 [Dactylosporangium sucinum]
MTNLDQQRAAHASDGGLGWLLTDFALGLTSVAHVVAVSSDGLALAMSEGLPTDRADQLAAITCGLASLTDGAARCLRAGPVSHTVVEMRGGVLLVMAIDDNAHVAVLVYPGADLGQVGFETALLAKKVGAALSPAGRSANNP